MEKKTSYILGAIFTALSVVFAVIAKKVDTATYVIENNKYLSVKIGFYKINTYIHNLTGVHMNWYDITDIMGILSIGFGLIFGLVGLIQLIKRKNLFKLDRYIYCLGGTYALLGIIYAAFEKITLNRRPIVMPGEDLPEASFPSSHTLLIAVIMITGAIQICRLFADKKAIKISLSAFCILFATVGVLGRFYSGVHWFTDIIESLIITAAICFFYYGLSKETKGRHSLNA
ncbi:MAG: phosphatase PAP2 family protein [Clostridia bacterium]|nr:phosphatase PAP2 family protein [Clostridia bacterium]